MTSSARTTTLLSLLAGALVLGLLLLASSPGTLTPDQIDQLRRSTDPALPTERLTSPELEPWPGEQVTAVECPHPLGPGRQ